jgi:hypothetical protein
MSPSGRYPGKLPPRAARSGTRPMRCRLGGTFRLMLAAVRHGPCCLVAKADS